MAKTFTKEIGQGTGEVLAIIETIEQKQTYTLKQLRELKQELKGQLDAVQVLLDQAKALNIKEDE